MSALLTCAASLSPEAVADVAMTLHSHGAAMQTMNFNLVLRVMADDGAVDDCFDFFQFMEVRREMLRCLVSVCWVDHCSLWLAHVLCTSKQSIHSITVVTFTICDAVHNVTLQLLNCRSLCQVAWALLNKCATNVIFCVQDEANMYDTVSLQHLLDAIGNTQKWNRTDHVWECDLNALSSTL